MAVRHMNEVGKLRGKCVHFCSMIAASVVLAMLLAAAQAQMPLDAFLKWQKLPEGSPRNLVTEKQLKAWCAVFFIFSFFLIKKISKQLINYVELKQMKTNY